MNNPPHSSLFIVSEILREIIVKITHMMAANENGDLGPKVS